MALSRIMQNIMTFSSHRGEREGGVKGNEGERGMRGKGEEGERGKRGNDKEIMTEVLPYRADLANIEGTSGLR